MKTKKKIFLVVILIFIFVGLFYIFYLENETYDCFDYIDTKDYQKAIETGKKVLKLDPENVDAYICLGKAYYETGQIDLAIDILKKAETYATEDEDSMIIYNLLGLNYTTKGDLDTALSYSSKSLRLAKKLGDRESETKSLNNVALIFYYKGELDKALEYFKESLRSTTDEKNKSFIYNNIALIYLNKGDYKRAIEYFKKAIEIDEKYGDYEESGSAMINLGNTYRKIKDFKNAYYYLSEGLKRAEKIGNKYWEGMGLASLGLYFADKRDITSAKEYLNRAYEIFKSIGAEKDASDVLKILSKLEEKERIR